MSAIALAWPAAPGGRSSAFLCDEFLTPREKSPRGPIEPACEEIAARLDHALEARESRLPDLALCFEACARIASLLGRPIDARRLYLASIARLASSFDRNGDLAALALALRAVLGLARIEAALGHDDEALFLFEKLAALPLGGSLEAGPLVVTPARFAEVSAFAPLLGPKLSAEAIAAALETLIAAARYDVALAVARVRDENDPPALDAFRREATATALCRMGLFGEALVFLASAVAREPLSTRPIFEQKRAEALAASGQLDAARARASFVVEGLDERLRASPASLDDLALAARALRVLGMLGQVPGAFAARAFELAGLVGDVPLEAELALRVVGSDAPRATRERAANVAVSLVGHHAPSFAALRDRLCSIAA
ncbi:hypothetical protein [Polyangium sp. 6x1]|uniref:hypothetical protein n=1 Tax=Polyangium sp. 6x1 TaxID=3042689 RepID=UPI00248310EC|nr:hypothetical protein [Polyangium sp. 6x1]MDI1447410.1 hypothetical protein [Polyangium sp. 6x1]